MPLYSLALLVNKTETFELILANAILLSQQVILTVLILISEHMHVTKHNIH